jgi:ribosomal-protein-alanine N-acetyltransferase
VDAILAIQSGSPEASQWSRDAYARAASGELGGWVAEADNRVAGFVVVRSAADEAEILNLAVEPESRRQGVARALLKATLDASRAGGARRVFLEVRESNAGAIAFYRSNGFRPDGRRPRYYQDPPEDALVLIRELR